MFDDPRLSVDGDEVARISRWVNDCRKQGPTLVHCQAGLNRSGIIVGHALMTGPERMTADDAIETMRRKRSPAVLCNSTFEQWLRLGTGK